MKNLVKVASDYKAKEFNVKGFKMNQLERNQFKADVVEALAKDLADAGFEVGKVDKGYAFLVENDELGSVALVLDAVVKNLDYSMEFEVEYKAEQDAEKARRLAERKARAKG